ncbi:MAG: DUF4835 family protein [Bacteroidales bacterium]|jgi:hypothetical protein|nr:DUF4835 family protein [Bacteroidales bacterium]MBQ5873856.1 DUF4835 family protein [Bacteroidales bacterium]MBQ5891525.1 DUF4835 family protein [Bacteroidales bacterium]MED9963121.1 DUF4835 family protein [Bacteroidales bacterium]MEE0882741.1 DUF4835 family protein [Bacteroidales bacterium]
MRRFLVCCLAFLFSISAFSQEFRVSVSVNSTQLQSSDREVFQQIQELLNEFVNERTWTDVVYEEYEKIEGSISITITEHSTQEDFKGDINIQLRRPVYGSTYTTTLLNTQEQNFTFKFIQGQSLEFDQNNYTNNLVSTIAFYLYYFLALDADSFEHNGGNNYFTICQNIVTASQRSASKGWKRAEDNRNKYWMVENYTNTTYRYLREASYQYHRLGLDMMQGESQAEARNNIMEALENVKRAHREKSDLVALKQFLDAKSDEIVNIFKGAPQNEKSRVVDLMKVIDPANTNKYEQILQQGQ